MHGDWGMAGYELWQGMIGYEYDKGRVCVKVG